MADKHYLREELYELVKKDERIFDFIQEGSLDGLWYWDLENPENEWMNEKFWKVLGYEPADMPHKSSAWQGIINQEDLKNALKLVKEHFENPDKPYDQEVRYTHKNGSTVWIRCRGIAIRDEHGMPVRMLGAHQDITSLKNAERELSEKIIQSKANEEKYRAIYNNTPMAIQSLDIDGNIIEVNPKWLEILEYEKNDVTGKWFGDFLHEDCKEHFRKKFPEFKKKGTIKDVEFRMICKSGRNIYVSFEGCIGCTTTGEFKQTYCTFKDITLEEEARAELEAYEERYRAIFESSGIGVGYYDTEFRIVDFNSVALDNLGGLRKEDVIGKKFEDFFPANQAEIYYKRCRQAIEQNEIFEFEDKISLPNGSYWYLSTYSPVNDSKGNIIGIQILSHDITKQKKAEEDFKESLIDLELAQEIAEIGYWKFDAAIGRPEWSEQVYKIYERDRTLGTPHIDDYKNLYDAQQYEIFNTAIQNAIQNGIPYDIELKIVLKSGKEKWLHAICHPDKEKGPHGHFLRGTIQDITTKKISEQALRESEEKYRFLAEKTSDLIIMVDGEGNIRYISPNIVGHL
jgi:PAS domain S-box-containing protein